MRFFNPRINRADYASLLESPAGGPAFHSAGQTSHVPRAETLPLISRGACAASFHVAFPIEHAPLPCSASRVQIETRPLNAPVRGRAQAAMQLRPLASARPSPLRVRDAWGCRAAGLDGLQPVPSPCLDASSSNAQAPMYRFLHSTASRQTPRERHSTCRSRHAQPRPPKTDHHGRPSGSMRLPSSA